MAGRNDPCVTHAGLCRRVRSAAFCFSGYYTAREGRPSRLCLVNSFRPGRAFPPFARTARGPAEYLCIGPKRYRPGREGYAHGGNLPVPASSAQAACAAAHAAARPRVLPGGMPRDALLALLEQRRASGAMPPAARVPALRLLRPGAAGLLRALPGLRLDRLLRGLLPPPALLLRQPRLAQPSRRARLTGGGGRPAVPSVSPRSIVKTFFRAWQEFPRPPSNTFPERGTIAPPLGQQSGRAPVRSAGKGAMTV